LTDLSATTPLTYNNTTGVFGITKADTSTDGYLSSTDWNTFNNKQTALGFTAENVANKKTTLTDNSDTYYPSQKAVKTAVDAKQDTLVSGTNIKTVNSNSLLGSGDISVGTVISVGGTGTVSGLTLSGTVTTTGNLTLGGTISGLTTSNLSASAGITNAQLAKSSITIAGTATSLGGSITRDTIIGVSTNGFVKRTGANTYTIDTNTYLTGNQTITLSGDISGSGTTAITTTIGAGKVTNSMLAGSIALSKLSITGTPDGTKFLRDDGS